MNESSFIVRVRGSCLGQRFGGGIRDEELLTCNTNALPSVLPVNFGCMRLQPRRIPIKLLALRSRIGQTAGIGYFFHENLA
jgi:hypothetical protein